LERKKPPGRAPRRLLCLSERNCKRDSVEDDHLSGTRIAARLERTTRDCAKRRARRPSSEPPPRPAASQPLFVLAPGRVCQAAVSPRRRCALTAPFHPCLCPIGPSAVSFLLHFPWGRPPWPLASTLPCGVPTFLGTSRYAGAAAIRSTLSSSSFNMIIVKEN